jgi:hypothetical protein
MYKCWNCGREYLWTKKDQRYCCTECRDEHRKAEARAARLLWERAKRPQAVLEEVKQEHVA